MARSGMNSFRGAARSNTLMKHFLSGCMFPGRLRKHNMSRSADAASIRRVILRDGDRYVEVEGRRKGRVRSTSRNVWPGFDVVQSVLDALMIR